MTTEHPLIRMLSAFEARVIELSNMLAQASSDMSPTWADADASTRSHAALIRQRAARQVWFATPVALGAFLLPGNRIAILSAEHLRSVLAARALFACRDAVRRVVERATRERIVQSIGAQALAALRDFPVDRHGDDVTLPADLSADALARLGWQLVDADGGCTHATLRNVIELTLASAANDEASGWDVFARVGMQARGVSSGGAVRHEAPRHSTLGEGRESASFFAVAGKLFPEARWLFG